MPIFSRFVESSFESLLSKNENRPADKLGSFGRVVVPSVPLNDSSAY